VYEVLNDKDKAKCYRITFNEITKPAILKALENPRQIDIR
jgi:DNA topoisomerase-1